jgi:integrase
VATPSFTAPALDALDALLNRLPAGQARRHQLGMVRAELAQALAGGALPSTAHLSLTGLLADDALRAYARVAATGALRTRLVRGQRPPTAAATNAARLSCLDQIREAAGLPPLQWGRPEPVDPRPVPLAGQITALRRHLDHQLTARASTPGQIRLHALIALVLDTAARSGELADRRLTDLDLDARRLVLLRQPQHGTDTPSQHETLPLTRLSVAAVERWLPVRARLVERAHGTSRLWVSLRPNHDGATEPAAPVVRRPPGMPLEERGLLRSYQQGRAAYGLQDLLPPKLEQLRRAVAGSLAG